MKMYLVGGFVRDEIMGVKSNDIDFSVVLDPADMTMAEHLDAWTPFEAMVAILKSQGFEIFLETPEHLTARGRFTGKGVFIPISDVYKHFEKYRGIGLDFVLARKEGIYTDGRRPDKVEVGSLEDDLARRDFRMNAIAKDEEGSYIDPFNGRADIEARLIRAVGDPFERLTEDALRAVRALRFAVTKGFEIDIELRFAMQSAMVLDKIVNSISDERIDIELRKMFHFDTVSSLRMLSSYPLLTNAMFSGNVSLTSTLKTKGMGK